MPILPFARIGINPIRLFREDWTYNKDIPFSRGKNPTLPDRWELEQDIETVIKVLQPGPLGIVEHKFSTAEMQEAKATVDRAVGNWRRNATLENHHHVMKSGKN